MGAQMEVLELDIQGQVCPSTLLIALREVNRHQQALKAGQLCLVVKTDARDATATIPQAVRNMGYPVCVTKQEGCYRIRIGSEGEA